MSLRRRSAVSAAPVGFITGQALVRSAQPAMTWSRSRGSRPGPPILGRLHFLSRVSVALKLASQVLPPSFEKDCSKRCESGVISDQTARTRMALP